MGRARRPPRAQRKASRTQRPQTHLKREVDPRAQARALASRLFEIGELDAYALRLQHALVDHSHVRNGKVVTDRAAAVRAERALGMAPGELVDEMFPPGRDAGPG